MIAAAAAAAVTIVVVFVVVAVVIVVVVVNVVEFLFTYLFHIRGNFHLHQHSIPPTPTPPFFLPFNHFFSLLFPMMGYYLLKNSIVIRLRDSSMLAVEKGAYGGGIKTLERL